MLAACFLSGIVWFLPEQLKRLGKALISTSAFAANVWLDRQAGYFANDADRLPLLHTWSLAVEEQFYIVFPLAMAFLRRRRLRTLALAIFAALSFDMSVAAVRNVPNDAFYLPQFRAWEFLVGSLIALHPLQLRPLVSECLGLIGILLITAGRALCARRALSGLNGCTAGTWRRAGSY